MARQHRKTNREIEIKLRITDIREIQRKINALGAVSMGRFFEANTLYDTPHSDFRRRGMLLRLRIETPAGGRGASRSGPERVVLTVKAPPSSASKTRKSAGKNISRYKERAERELQVTDSRRWVTSLIAMGFRPAFRYEKYRTTFVLPKLHLDLDETPVGIILELEGAPKAIERAARALGFRPSDYLRCTYWDLYAADCRRRGVVPKNMVFSAK